MTRTNKADDEYNRKRKRVLRYLKSHKWQTRSTNWIAMQAGVSWLFADKVRTQFDDAPPSKREARSGKQYASSIGRK